jgi:hypothetical protein
MSSTFASRRCAASTFAFSNTSMLALCTALPAICSDREPMVPEPRGTTPVSDWTSRTFSIGMPSSSCTIIANAVRCPWPCDDVPTVTSTPPSAAISTLPYSWNKPGAVISTYVDTPMPSSFRSPLSRRVACSLRRSSYPAMRHASSSGFA